MKENSITNCKENALCELSENETVAIHHSKKRYGNIEVNETYHLSSQT
jgi:hypothetical protein